MTKSQLERKLRNLKKELIYYAKVYPNSEKRTILKSIYRHYRKINQK